MQVGRPAKQLLHFSQGDPCKGLTKLDQEIIGFFIQPANKSMAYMRGVIAKNGLASPFEPTQIYKVKRSSLRKC